MSIQAILFDLDGTLADTLPVCIQAFQETIAHFNGERPSPAQITSMFGPTEEGMLETMLPGRLDETLPQYLKEYERFHSLCPQPFPGVERVFELLKAKNIPSAIVTGKGRYSAEISVRILGLDRWVDCVETGFAAKPDKPVSIRKVLERWQMSPEQAAYIGDTPYDMRASREAGLLPLGAAWAETSLLRRPPQPDVAVMFYEIDRLVEWIAAL